MLSTNCQDFSALIEKLKGYLQNNVDNDIVINFLELLRKTFKKKFPEHLSQNRLAFPNHINTIKHNKGFIEDQGNYKDMSYGLLSLSANGCELIAIYNALYELTQNENIDFPFIIDKHERDGMILSGLFGTSVKAIQEYFDKDGFKTLSSSKKENYENIANKSDVLIFTMYNNAEDITDQIHTVCITKKNGKYYVHNNGKNSANFPYDSMTDVLNRINNGHAKDLFLIGINKK